MNPAAARRQRAIGALIGSAVGDALGAPFEFGPAGRFSRRFPEPQRGVRTEMCGGGPWAPGEVTDDTQMALLLAASLLAHDGLDEADVFDRFAAWAAGGAKDVGIQTRAVFASGQPWQTAARQYFEAGHRAAGNGSLMRTVPAALYFASAGAAASAEAARRISNLTHGDPAAGDGCVLFHRMVAVALDGGDPLAHLDAALATIPAERREKWQTVLTPGWAPGDATEPNGAVWPTLGTAVWALRRYVSFEQAMRAVIDIGGDTDTIACVAGGLLGAVFGIEAIPCRWTIALTGNVPGSDLGPVDYPTLLATALRLIGDQPPPDLAERPPIEPVEVEPGLWLTNLAGAARGPADAVVISLCRVHEEIPQPIRRRVYLTDDDSNLAIETVLEDVTAEIAAFRAEGRPVLVHCWAGESRTGLVLRAWLVRSRGLSAADAADEAQRLWPGIARWNQDFDGALERWARGRSR